MNESPRQNELDHQELAEGARTASASYLERLIAYLDARIDHPSVWWLLGFFSAIESIFFPIPVDVMLVSLAALRPKRWLSLSLVTTITSVIGAAIGYGIGFLLFDSIGMKVVEFYGLGGELLSAQHYFTEYAGWAMFVGAFTPIPFKIFTLAAGLLKAPFAVAMIASFIGRVIRYVLVGWLSARYGEVVTRRLVRMGNQALLWMVGICVALVVVWVVLK